MPSDPTPIDLFRYRTRRDRDLKRRGRVEPKREEEAPSKPSRNDPRAPRPDDPPPAA